MKKSLFFILIFLLCACNNKNIKETEFSTNIKVECVDYDGEINLFIHENKNTLYGNCIHIKNENGLLEFYNALVKCERIIQKWRQIAIDNNVTDFIKVIPIEFPEIYNREKYFNCLMNDEEYSYNIKVSYQYKTKNEQINITYPHTLYGEFDIDDKGNMYFYLLGENMPLWGMTLDELNWLISQINPSFVKQTIKEKKDMEVYKNSLFEGDEKVEVQYRDGGGDYYGTDTELRLVDIGDTIIL